MTKILSGFKMIGFFLSGLVLTSLSISLSQLVGRVEELGEEGEMGEEFGVEIPQKPHPASS